MVLLLGVAAEVPDELDSKLTQEQRADVIAKALNEAEETA